jgi:hypothetical protein
VRGEWRRLHIEELYNLYSSPNIILFMKLKRVRWAGRGARMGEKKNACRVLLEKPEGERPLGIATRRWDDIIKIELKCMRCKFVKLIWPKIEKAAG